jgi:acetyl esterase
MLCDMAYVVKMPKLGLEMEQGTVLEWYLEEGEAVTEGNALLEVESEKSIGEVEAREDGLLRLVAVTEDETVTPGTPIGIVAAESEDITDLEAEFGDTNGDADAEEFYSEGHEADDEAPASTAAGTMGAATETAGAETAGNGAGETDTTDGTSSEVKASPRAKRRAEETGVALASVEGSGPRGAVTADDVDAAASEADEGDADRTDAGETAAEVTGATAGNDTEDDAEAAASTELHPQAEALLHDLSAAGIAPLYRQSVPEARATYRDLCIADGEPEPVERAADGSVPGPDGPVPIRVYDPGESEGNDAEGGDARSSDARARPVLAFFHGGGWMTGDRTTHDGVCRALANTSATTVVSVEYRRAPEHPFPAALEDCYAVTAWLAGGPDFGAVDPELGDVKIDPGRVAVGGDSAGGTLAAGVALLARDRGESFPCHQLLAYPATDHRFDTESYTENANGYFVTRDDMERFWDTYLEVDADGRHPYASPLRAADPEGLAPATVLTCGFDPLRDDGRAYADRLAEADVPVERVAYPDMIHGFLTMLADPEWERAHEAISVLGDELHRAFEA